MSKDFTATPHVVPRLVLAFALMLPGLCVAEPQPGRYRVHLQNADQSLSLHIGDVHFERQGNHTSYRVEMNEAGFGDYFLSMRPFKCMTDQVDMLCHLPYPYALERRIIPGDLSALEHEFLFIRRKPAEYGIDPWNGLYYKLEASEDGFSGQAYEVDLNILAAPPEDDALPLLDAEMSEGDAERLWLSRIVIEPE